ncbi:HNH endonuclease [Sulfitobacter donghicola]|uniref:HNH endonuclease n=1 Tax=Sulfitobacter donghicola TaxID=421000 RepID=UPI00056A7061|nr:HNH endonuclease signature motif containing protein [Sulfitobacter donghicola]
MEHFTSVALGYIDLHRAINKVRLGQLGVYDNYSWTTYIICPETNEPWDLKPVVGLALENAGLDPNSFGWVTTRFQPQLLRLGFSILKFAVARPRELGIRGFSPTEFTDDHSLLIPPNGDIIIGGATPYPSSETSSINPQTEGTVRRYIRNAKIALDLRKKANGYCSSCGQRTFKTAVGDWYIEIHHKRWLSEGGADSAENLIALCPTCHRSEHHSDQRRYY